MELISIIMPYYKKKNFIDQSIQSVLNQTYKKFELLIVYDDFDKEELYYLKKFVDSDDRVKIIENEKNLGAGLSRNKGIELSKGRFIAFLDSDDLWSKSKLEKQIKFMTQNNCFISHTSYEIIDSQNTTVSKRVARDFNNFKSLLKSCDIGLSTVVIDKKIITHDLRFPSIKTKEDFVLWLDILKKNYQIKGLSENLAKWRKTNNSLSSSVVQKLKDGFKVYNYYMGFNYFVSIYLLICLSLNFLKKND
ncbi:glycosyltransferase family 2 protein [Candidatus Pelagibacter sp.]|nr:glycosyltransferase family 2 protein [Candidatus Pelagibacter sp.]